MIRRILQLWFGLPTLRGELIMLVDHFNAEQSAVGPFSIWPKEAP